MEDPLDPLDLVRHSARIEKLKVPAINTELLAETLEDIAQQAANLINADLKEEFLYKNPKGWQTGKTAKQHPVIANSFSDSSDSTFVTASSSTASSSFETEDESWSSIGEFEFHLIVHQINEFVRSWELTPATKFVVIGLSKTENKFPFGKRYFVEAHFSKPTPKCPNPLAVAKVYFKVSVSQLLPKYYPVHVTYKFEGYKTKFYVMGERQLSSNKFQRFYIDTILHMKLAFYAELCECRNPMNPLVNRKRSGKFL